LTRLHHSRRGSSLIELLTAMLVLAILAAISYDFVRAAFMSAAVQEAKSEAQEVAVMVIDAMARELRMAGFSAAGQSLAGVRAADREYVEVASDLNGDGDIDDSNELVAYSYDAGKSELMRATGGGSPQPAARNIPRGGVQFTFFDADGAEVAAAGPLTSEERRRIRRVDVLLRVELPNPDPGAALPLTATASSSVCLRNQ
jgi:prepilin-type N-terminal cleavage/methylation domain-containing protein